MPQLWVTYDELAAELSCSPEEARAASHLANWPHKHSHDGLTRTMLPQAIMVAFMLRQGAALLNEQGVVVERLLKSELSLTTSPVEETQTPEPVLSISELPNPL